MNKLSKFILDIRDAHLAEGMVRTLRDFEKLRTILPQVFPASNDVEELLTILQPTPEQKKEKDYDEDNLPLHTRDDKWMAEYMSRALKASPLFVEDPKVKFKNIKYFIQVDPEYQAERNRYEQDVIRTEIKDLMLESNTINYNGSMKNNIKKSINADDMFYNELLNKLLAFGMNPHSIEVGLEKNAHLWRDEMMETAFINKYLRPLVKNKDALPAKDYINILDIITEQRQDWTAIREYNYYQKHKRVIDELGTATENMKIPAHQAFIKEMAWKTNYREIIEPLMHKITANTEIIRPQNTDQTMGK